MPTVGVIGSGSVGLALAGRIALTKEYEIVMSSRHPSELKEKLEKEGLSYATASVEEAVKSDIIVLCVPGSPTDEGCAAIAKGLGSCAGKVVIDATNPLTAFPGLEVRWTGKSAGEIIAENLPEAAVYKAFNTIGVEHMIDPTGGASDVDKPEDMLVAGDDRPEFKAIALKLVKDVGYVPRYVGPIRYARNLEAIAELWIHLAVPPAGDTKENWGRNWNFQVQGVADP